MAMKRFHYSITTSAHGGRFINVAWRISNRWIVTFTSSWL